MKQRYIILFLIFSLFTAAGAGCPSMVRSRGLLMPRVLPPSPTVEQVIAVVNRNSQLVHSFTADKAEISVSGVTLRANMAMTRPNNFRLQAGTLITGSELDLGSNDQLFWFWVRRDESNAVYYCQHDQFESSSLRHNMPVSPKELVEAFGLVEFDLSLPHHLSKRADGNLEMRTVYQTPSGMMTRVAVIHSSYGWVLEQSLYDNHDHEILHTVAQQHRRDPLTGLVMPKVVVINLPANQMEMRVNLGNVAINTLDSVNPDLWTMPTIQGTTMVNLGCPIGGFGPTPFAPAQDPYRTPGLPIAEGVGAF